MSARTTWIAADAAKLTTIVKDRQGNPLQFAIGTTLRLRLGLFENAVLDSLSGFTAITVEVKPVGAAESTPAIIQKNLSSGNINSVLTLSQWNALTASHLDVTFTSGEMNNLNAGIYLLCVWGVEGSTKKTWFSQSFEAFQDGCGETTVAPQPVASYYTAAQVDTLLASQPVRQAFSSVTAMKGADYSGYADKSLVVLRGYNTDNDGGSGDFYVDKTDTTTADNGGTVFVANDGTRVKRLFSGAVNVKWFGAKGDAVADDTVAIQSAVNYCISARKWCYAPDGNYLISDSIKLVGESSVFTGFRFSGSGRYLTKITQSVSNRAIFEFGSASLYNHSHVLSDFHASWSTQQATTDTNSAVVLVQGTSSNYLYNSRFSNIFFSNANCFIKGVFSSLWGNVFEYIWGYTFSSSFSVLTGEGGASPNNLFNHIYLLCTEARGPIFHHFGMTARMDCIELNQCLYGPVVLKDFAGGFYSIGTFGIEGGTYLANTDRVVFEVTNTRVSVDTIYFTAITIEAGASVRIFVGDHTFNIRNLFIDFTSNSGTVTVFDWATGKGILVADHLEIPAVGPNFRLNNVSETASPDNIVVTSWVNPQKSKIQSDADLTISYNETNYAHLFNMVTANRIVTLPNHKPENSNGLFGGWRVRISKLTTAAFTITIKDVDGNTLATLPSGSRATAEFTWRKQSLYNWLVTDSHVIT